MYSVLANRNWDGVNCSCWCRNKRQRRGKIRKYEKVREGEEKKQRWILSHLSFLPLYHSLTHYHLPFIDRNAYHYFLICIDKYWVRDFLQISLSPHCYRKYCYRIGGSKAISVIRGMRLFVRIDRKANKPQKITTFEMKMISKWNERDKNFFKFFLHASKNSA